MTVFRDVLAAAFELLEMPLTMYGISFSMWQVLIFSLVGSMIGYILGRFFNG